MFFKRKNKDVQNKINCESYRIEKDVQDEIKYEFPNIEGADEYLWKAAEVFTEKQQGNAATLQRKLNVGFNRALSIMEQLYQIGVLGEAKGNTISRDVLVDKNGLIEIADRLKSNKFQITKEKNVASERMENIQTDRLKMYNGYFDYMTGEDFELFISRILGKIGFWNIHLTKGSGDQGVDILAEKDGIKYAVQCKRYDKPVGNSAVQEVFAGKFFYHCHAAIVVTNNYFTQSAKELARENGVVLWDRDYLQNILNSVKNNSHAFNKNALFENEEELTKSLKDIAVKISNVFTTFQIKAPIVDIYCDKNETIFWIQPPIGVRIKTILSYKQEIEIELKIPIQIRPVSEKGRIGIFIFSNDLSKYIKKRENVEKEN